MSLNLGQVLFNAASVTKNHISLRNEIQLPALLPSNWCF